MTSYLEWLVGMDVCVKFGDSRLKLLEVSFLALFFWIVINFLLEVASDDISSVVADLTSMDVHVKFGDSRSNRSPDILQLSNSQWPGLQI